MRVSLLKKMQVKHFFQVQTILTISSQHIFNSTIQGFSKQLFWAITGLRLVRDWFSEIHLVPENHRWSQV